MKKKIITFVCGMAMALSGLGTAGITHAQEPGTPAIVETATGTDAQPQVDTSQVSAQLQADAVEMDAVHVSAQNVTIGSIAKMDMGRYSIVGVPNTPSADVYYRWQMYDFTEGTWTTFHDWDTATCVFWEPSHAGDYNVYVEAMSGGAVVASYAQLYYFSGCVTTLGSISYACGTSECTYDISYTTNDTELQFRWQAYDVANGTWCMIRDWSGESAGNWVPEHAGDYFLYVEAKGGDGAISSKLLVCHVDEAQITSFIQSCTSGFVNEIVVMAGTYTDPTNNIGRQRYLVFDGTYWTELASYQGQGLWNPSREGQYLLCYEIYDKKGVLVAQQFKQFLIEKPYVNFGELKETHTVGLDFHFEIDVDTNDPGIHYRWQYYDIAKDAWYVIADYPGGTKVDWTPEKEGYYWVTVEAMLRDGTVKSVTKGVVANRIQSEESKMQVLANSYASNTSYLLLVNGATHKVGVFSGSKGNWTMLAYWDCSDGKASTPTVRGEFTVGSKGSYFDSGDARCYYYTQFYGDYLFHSVLYNKYNGNLADGRLGMGLSHGCVRLQIDNAKWIYDNIPSGTKVVVYN
ncbi:L,D-transpeptidase family protein [Eubacterium sp. MSJ-21]|nr:L,D-transpeptidase family protein [Eubacterium sp. MSJ-21]